MSKTILITGSTDGIGLLTAKTLAAQGHKILLHGRSQVKLDAAVAEVGGTTGAYVADLSKMADVTALADAILADHDRLDVLINNAGVYKVPQTRAPEGHDVRFVVNTFGALGADAAPASDHSARGSHREPVLGCTSRR